ncbi:MAG: penicillin-binding protein 2 [Patescibacteria group bacterium]
MKWRITSLIFIFGILYSFLIFSVYNIQIKKSGYYLNKAKSLIKLNNASGAPRNSIYFIDRNNNFIQAALNKEYPIIYAVPVEIQTNAGGTRSYAEKLSQILNIPIDDLEKKFNKQNDSYELLIQKAGAEQVEQIKNLNLKGIYIDDQQLRFYPFGELASHLLGFTTASAADESGGRYGAELYFNEALGKENLILTIDRNIQAQAEEILKNLIDQYQAIAGTVIVQEPQTGKILAMGNFPNFNPNDYSKFKVGNFLNPAVQSVYEPGSVFKVITMAAGIDSGKITPETTYIDTGSVTFNGKTIKNWDLKAHGLQTMTGVIEQSINTGAVFAQRKIGQDIFYNYLIKFGFNEITNIALPGEVRGKINNLKQGKDIDFATASFGQGVAITPIELISAFSAIANDGVLMKPIISANEKPQVVRRVISFETAKKIAKMMVSAVDKNIVAAIPNFSVAGKTGTAFVPDFGKNGYTDKVINTYMGFAPAFDPKFVILIKLDKPMGSPLAGQTVVPAFRELAQFILNYYNIAPDRLIISN